MENDITKMFEKINTLMHVREDIKKDLLTNPEEKLKELGIEINTINPELLKKQVAGFEILKGALEEIFPTDKLGNLTNLSEKLRKQESISPEDLTRLSKVTLDTIPPFISEKGKECFWLNKEECEGDIVNAHSIQKRNNKLTLLAKNSTRANHVYQFEKFELLTNDRKIELVPISEAGTFYGFCQKHDREIFSPIETGAFNESDEHCFLHSYRSFAYTYHRIKEFHNYISTESSKGVEIAKKLFDAATSLYKDLATNVSYPVPTFKSTRISPAQSKELEEQRFERHRAFLNKYYERKRYKELDYIVHKTNHISPIVASSRLILHLEIKGAYLIPQDGVYRGIPCMLTIFPEGNNTYIILSRFKFDTHSELLFNGLRKLSSEDFELKITSLIFEQLENFYVAPVWWDSLSSDEKIQMINDINAPKQGFPNSSTFVPSLNIFDKKYSL